MAHDLEPYENITRVFWIKIELNEQQHTGQQALGDIKDVISGEKQAIYQLLDIIYFMIPYLEHMGIKVNWFWRFSASVDLLFTPRKRFQEKLNKK